MSGKVCRETRLEIDQSELRQPLSAEAEAHAATCAGCAAFRDERFRLRELVGALEPVVAPADFDVHLRARIARERDSHKQPFGDRGGRSVGDGCGHDCVYESEKQDASSFDRRD